MVESRQTAPTLSTHPLPPVPVRSAIREQEMGKTSLDRRPGLGASLVRRLPAPGHRSRIGRIGKALRSVGRRLAVQDRAA